MMRPSAIQRGGVTLLEVLVAIFVMAIGLLALLVLFPLGALSMQSAIQFQRASEAGYNAVGIGEMKSVAQDTRLLVPGDPFLNPYTPAIKGVNNASNYGSSYPVLVDAIGWRASVGGSAAQLLVGGTGSFLSRRTVSYVNTTLDAYHYFADLNDIDWENGAFGTTNSLAGTPRWLLPGGPGFTRNISYSWGYLLQRPRYGDACVVDAQIVVYNSRSVSLSGTLTLPEYVYNNIVYINPASNTFTVNYGVQVPPLPPPVRVGDWVLDNTPITNPDGTGTAHGYFYRVVATNDTGGAVELEVEQPMRGVTYVAGVPTFVGARRIPTASTRATPAGCSGRCWSSTELPRCLPRE